MKNLLITTAALEVAAALALVIFPGEAAALLISPALSQTAATVAILRITGTALLTLGIANWLAHYDTKSIAAKGIIEAMVIYNLGISIILAAVSFQIQPVGLALWPATILHLMMATWCIISLLNKSAKSPN